jgi:hypothetical protein
MVTGVYLVVQGVFGLEATIPEQGADPAPQVRQGLGVCESTRTAPSLSASLTFMLKGSLR